MKLRNVLLIILTGFCSAAFSQQKSTTALPRPKLVVGLVVDQMRWDYLYRFYERYGTGGFKRLLNEGFSCENTQVAYAPTLTACGHASLYTGSVPSIHGITGNDWIVQSSGYHMYAQYDTLVKSVGTTSAAGEMSPRNLLTTTVTDELKLATNFRSKVIGIALKDKGAIFSVGRSADAAYWYDDTTGNWITSTYYRANLPAWVEKFNSDGIVKKYFKKWETLYPIASYKQSSPDDSPRYEGKLETENAPVFPHIIAGSTDIEFSPFGNTLTFDFARGAIENEKMGKSGITDFLAISLSTSDIVGHLSGPNAIEMEDLFLRLDKDIADFLTYLDNTIGKGQYTVFLSADHGAAHNRNFLTDHKIGAGGWEGTNYFTRGLKEINNLLEKKYGTTGLVRSLINYQVHFNYPLISEKGLDLNAIKRDAIDFYKVQKGVNYVVDLKNIGNEPIPEVLKSRLINGYNRTRSGEVQIVLYPGYYNVRTGATTGTTHGSLYPYDTHIPLIFMGWGIKQGKTNRTISICDVAPTISSLLHIQEPNGNIGQTITEVLK